ncbi:MAG TPA: type 1 glutamine amidotransferase [Gaiellales bacterium]|jgi:GMP synthase-like glutamine amidotransferase
MARALHIQNESTDPAVPFVEALEQHGFEVQTLHPYRGDALPETLDGVDAMVAGGGLVDTHQAGEVPWLFREIQLVREALVRGTPYMGLCLGAQILTEAAGGTVYRSEPHEVGWHDVELLPPAGEDRLFGGLPNRFPAMQWHYYACRPNEQMVELARNETAVQAMRVGDAAWGTQFHIEVTRPVLMMWLDMGGDDLARNGYPRDRFLASIDEHLEDHLEIGRTLADRFAGLAATRAGESPAPSSG